LTLTAALTGLLWIPYTYNRVQVWGLAATMGYPKNPKLLAPWAERMKKAHYNAIENLVLFAALVLVAHALNKFGNATSWSAMTYFWARLAHAVVMTLGIPWLRTISFTVGWLACVCIFTQIFL
jgi:uncharacterized MAPEG superfamily protein